MKTFAIFTFAAVMLAGGVRGAGDPKKAKQDTPKTFKEFKVWRAQKSHEEILAWLDKQPQPKATKEQLPAYLKKRFQMELPATGKVENYHARVGLEPLNEDELTWDYFARVSLTPQALADFCKAWRDGANPKGQRRYYEENMALPRFGSLPQTYFRSHEVAGWMKPEMPWVFGYLNEGSFSTDPADKGRNVGVWHQSGAILMRISKKTNHMHLWAYERIGEKKKAEAK